ncbi:pyruvate, water dikinase regulatory protein [Fusibacter sp. 3D3]|uniref:pyruvate, water dikinase regulatory protein n=1 Tax=Fusibacter sp. 3D3 TaxID=1048380 RepID=UPI000852F86E|nr:pyruvate, water dikinase regulatory protein [Fusibacter sp. 3D3]GAU77479.1 ATP/GTP-binding protein [Fusibacter sp. 3D3]
MDNRYHIFILSDSLGETATHVAKAAMNQFLNKDYIVKKYNYVRDEDAVEEIVIEASRHKSVILFTTVLDEMRLKIISSCEQHHVTYHDILSPVLNQFAEFFADKPVGKPGTMYKLDDDYFERVAAIEFAVKYDDGKDLRGLKYADVVLLGISRTSKTPLSMYLSHKNVKVANVPLVPEIPVAKEIFQVPKNKLIGLTNSPDKLNEIRMERLKALGLSSDVEYANMDRILQELDYAEKVYKQLGCPIINVANKAIEETASIILEITGLNMKLK